MLMTLHLRPLCHQYKDAIAYRLRLDDQEAPLNNFFSLGNTVQIDYLENQFPLFIA